MIFRWGNRRGSAEPYGHYGIHVQQGAVTIPALILQEKTLSHHLPDPFCLFPFPKRGLRPSSGVRYPRSSPHPGPVLLRCLARENPPNKQRSGTSGISETPQTITKEEQFFQDVFPEALQ